MKRVDLAEHAEHAEEGVRIVSGDRRPAILVDLPIATKSPNRIRGFSRGAMMGIHAERARVRDLARALTLRMMGLAKLTSADLVPARVTFTRISAGTLDLDNCIASLKNCQDGVCKAIGVDDGDRAAVEFKYEQRKGKKGQPAVHVLIERR